MKIGKVLLGGMAALLGYGAYKTAKENSELRGKISALEDENSRLSKENRNITYQLGKATARKDGKVAE